MITGAILSLFGNILQAVLSLLPTATLPVEITSAIQWMVDSLFAWNWIIPASALLNVVLLSIALYTGMFAFSGLRYILNLIRGSGA